MLKTMRASFPKRKQLLTSFPSLRSWRGGIFAGTFVALGLIVVLISHAAGPYVTTEAENGTISGAATTGSDAAASGGQYVALNAPTPTPTGCAVGVTGTAPACATAPPVAAASGKHWDVTFSEEFNSSSYDTAKLTPCFDWNSGDCTGSFNQGYEYYEPSAISVSGGLGHLNATPLLSPQDPNGCGITQTNICADNACLNGVCKYKSGLLSTARKRQTDPITAYLYKFTYGYIEASFKVPSTQGFFIAWWMLPADPTFNYTYTPTGTAVSGNASPPSSFRYEIDILEALGSDPTDMEMHYHYANGSNDHYSPNEVGPGINGTCATLDYSKGQHRFGVDWEPTYIAFYIDGVKCGQHNATSNAPVPNVPMQLIMDQMVNNNWQRSIGKGLLDTTLSNDVPVDYMRVYQHVP